MDKIALVRPKYPHNVGGVIRAAALFGDIDEVVWTEDRFGFDNLDRLPREERIKDYKHINWCRDDRPFDRYNKDVIPVAVERRDNAECLYDFIHPKKAMYIFGPEDGSIPQVLLRLCHRFIYIPMNHCANLACAVNIVLYDRNMKRRKT